MLCLYGNGMKQEMPFRPSKYCRIKKYFFILFTAVILLYPYINILQKVKRKDEHKWDAEIYSVSHVLREYTDETSHNELPSPIVFEGYHAHLMFYTEILEIKKNINISFKEIKDVQSGDTILLSQEYIMDEQEKLYVCEVLET